MCAWLEWAVVGWEGWTVGVLLLGMALPKGLIRVRVRGRFRIFLVREIQWAPAIVVLGTDGEEYTIPARNYGEASLEETSKFWDDLEEAIHRKHCEGRN